MKGLIRVPLVVIGLCLMIAMGMSGMAGADTDAAVGAAVPNAQLPVLLTSAGQCPQIDVLAMLCDLAGLKYDFDRMPSVAALSAGVGLGGDPKAEIGTDLKKFPKGTKYKTVFITMGASMKGMGAAGIDADWENKRVEDTVAWFRKQGVFMIGVHVAGEDRRYHYLSEGMIDRVAPYCNLLLIAKASNEDGRFTTISKQKGIPMVLVDLEFDLVEVIEQIFKLK